MSAKLKSSTKSFVPKSAAATQDSRIETLFRTLGNKSNITSGLTKKHRAALKGTSHGQNTLPQFVKKPFAENRPISAVNTEMHMEYYKGPITDEAAFSMIKEDYVTKKDEHDRTNEFVCILKDGNSYKRIEYTVGDIYIYKVHYTNKGTNLEYKYLYTDKSMPDKQYTSLNTLLKNSKAKPIDPKAATSRSRSRSRNAARAPRSRSRSRNAASAPRSRSRNAAKPAANLGAWVNGGNRKSRRQTRRKLK